MGICILFIPKLVDGYLRQVNIQREVRIFIMLGGIVWLFLAWHSPDMYSILGLSGTDGNTYATWAYERIIPMLEAKNYEAVFQLLASPGRRFYVAAQGLFYYFTDGTIISIQLLNGFFAYWGGLILVRLVYSSRISGHSGWAFLPSFLVFAPSVFFWCSSSLKEGLMYWCICNILGFAMPGKTTRQEFRNFICFIISVFLGGLIRPHLIIIWYATVIFVKLFQKGFLPYALIIIVATPFFLENANKKVSLDYLAASVQRAEYQMKLYIERDKASTFDYRDRSPIPVVDGMVNTLFRPFIWRLGNLRSLITALEIWTLSICILFFWLRMTVEEWKAILKIPSLWVALLVCIPFFLFFTYTVNEGLLARQRVQLFPALLVLFATPILQRRAQSGKGLGSEIRGQRMEDGRQVTDFGH